ncbi:glucomannan 4-beta-mannosyltransferase 1-like isoform X2 [Dioscorea cayenensis subsp. rotundata]|uniref:Glucomannan 4-beta-mannosyltransferase 1-like isoform X2 n=1 Tax=Dioscorea cayennensis subsp. rotundata TaxID=55577 RepID=A0AB40AWG9_DIOCR|nr:glucomannan 4-beta-mannosyltransferase 1-like isoform X2 [Dioscorea cayenensis subsp. rotundata]
MYGMSLMLLVEFVFMAVVSLGVKILRNPEIRYKWEALTEDPEIGTSVYPIVLVQNPIINKKEVYKLSIGAACGLAWPPDRFIIQVLGDSTDTIVKIPHTWCIVVEILLNLREGEKSTNTLE